MRAFDELRFQRPNRLVVLTLVMTLLFAGCSATNVSRTSARLEIQEDVGFTITEEGRISSDARTDYENALYLLEQGQQEQGIALLKKVVDEAPQLSAPYIDLGIALHSSGQLEEAAANLQKALALSPDHPVIHNELGIVYRKTGRFAEARKSYENALDIYPGFHFARLNLAILCDLYLADLECALAHYQAYMQTVPGDDDAAIWIADIQNRVSNK
jgi:Flp pilus assembly protein TadD